MSYYSTSAQLKALAVLALTCVSFSLSTFACEAFHQQYNVGYSRRESATSLNMAFTPPTMIIGPMIRRMREEKEKKNQPLASDEEKAKGAPGLKVGANAWKWPVIWPYDPSIFDNKKETVEDPAMNPAMALLGGGGVPDFATPPIANDTEVFDTMKFWDEELSDVTTDLDSESTAKLATHFSFYLEDGMSVLELGAAENSYLPSGLKLDRHVGVGAVKKQMDKNDALTERLVVDLNNCIDEIGVNSTEFDSMGTETFDYIISSNTVDFLSKPREVFRSVWRLLKPGGKFIVAFSSKDAYADKFGDVQINLWRSYTDDQHMWIMGSYFQFSAGDGWTDIQGYDISVDDAKKEDIPIVGSLLNKDKPPNLFVVQATKVLDDAVIDESNPERSVKSKMWLLPVMDDRDKTLLAPRLARAYVMSDSEETKKLISDNMQESLPKVYKALVKMDQFSFPFSLQASLTADLVSDPNFVANDEQLRAMKMGLGLIPPSEEFWTPVGQLTAAMTPEDKVNLLANIVPRFGSGDHTQEAALESFVSGLKPTFSLIRSKCPGMDESDVQLLGTELLAIEMLKPGRSTRDEFSLWVSALTEKEMNEYLATRKSYQINSEAGLKKLRDDRETELREQKETQEKFENQVKKARDERTMAFNPETGKMEALK
mmetsp:Transcript_11232/g.12829  ORF Transcript_11232/g.12829 Transcript_11232/m.12829 type:complete len:657 (-) Transcript_11232:104-2074(-)|eukprot:CAMPEP_0194390830 /NCGR_PEP_ID=MMETSP0174-20130528/112240_1 /TAXON_ID=216777 /ORGANISM="Proboscia alata, Strain PI-D3" /LENGTH=656 /DNA_ID=CAMNT_0039184583 /DNA_START=60 /DNA_END=2030 /DNA_ORIENTATION=-